MYPEEGQTSRITLPKSVGEKLGISLGDVLGFYEEDGRITIQKMK